MEACRGRISALVVAFGLVVLGGAGLSPAWPSAVWPSAEAAAQTTAPTTAPTGTWSVATSPSPAGLMANQLNAVSCPASGRLFRRGLQFDVFGDLGAHRDIGAYWVGVGYHPSGPRLVRRRAPGDLVCLDQHRAWPLVITSRKEAASRPSSRLWPTGRGR